MIDKGPALGTLRGLYGYPYLGTRYLVAIRLGPQKVRLTYMSMMVYLPPSVYHTDELEWTCPHCLADCLVTRLSGVGSRSCSLSPGVLCDCSCLSNSGVRFGFTAGGGVLGGII